MGRTAFTLNTLPGSGRSRSIELNYGLSDPEGVKKWEAGSTPAGGGKHVNYYGQERGEISRFNRRMVLRGVNVSQANWHHLRSWRDQGEPLALSPLWSGATLGTVNTVLPLGKPAPGEDPLQDFLIADKRSAVDFERYCNRYHPDTGLEAGFHVPLYTDGWQGEQINVGDVINDTHFPSFEYRAYIDRDAADVGSITRVYLDPRWDVDVFWVGQYVCIQTRELTTNKHEIARVDAVNSAGNYMDLSKTPAVDAVLDNTADYTYASRTSVSNNWAADGDMSDSGTGSWTDEAAPELKEKNNTQNETGTNCLRIISSVGNSGVEQIIGDIPAGTDMVIWVRAKGIMYTGANVFHIQLWNETDGTFLLDENIDDTGSWLWYRFACKVADGATDPSEIRLRLRGEGADPDEFLIDRVEIYQNAIPNGAMEPADAIAYDHELAAIITSTAANTTYIGNVVDDATPAGWDLSDVVIGMMAVESGGAYGRITLVDDVADQVTVGAWVNGPPVNGNACAVHVAVAPDWDEHGIDVPPAGADVLLQNSVEHGGGWAQEISVDGVGEGIETAGNVVADGPWYVTGAYINMSAGTIRIRADGSGGTLATTTTTGSYEFVAAVFGGAAAETLQIEASTVPCDGVVDDVFLVRIPSLAATDNGPYDDAYYDLPEPLAVDGFTLFGVWVPDIANTEETVQSAYCLDISQRTYDTGERTLVAYNWQFNRFEFYHISNAVTQFPLVAETFLAGDVIHWAAKMTAGGDMKLWIKKNADATSSGTDAGASPATAMGLTRAWIGRRGDANTRQGRGTCAGNIVINETMADADIEEILEIMAGDTGYEAELTLLEETYGIIYEIEPNGITPWHPADGEYVKCDIALREVGRIGAFSNAY